MDPTKLLEAHHRQVEALFEAIDKAEGDARMPLIEELKTSLRAHMQLEEQILYPAMEPAAGEESVEEAKKEHELARKSLADIIDLAPDDPGFGAAMEATKAGIAHNVEEEENEIFPKLRKDGATLERIATSFMQTRLEVFTARGYEFVYVGEGPRNGVAVAARHPVRDRKGSGNFGNEHLDREAASPAASDTPNRSASCRCTSRMAGRWTTGTTSTSWRSSMLSPTRSPAGCRTSRGLSSAVTSTSRHRQ